MRLILLIAVLIPLLHSRDVLACTCRQLPINLRFAEAGAVFEAEVVEIKQTEREHAVDLKITKTFRGNVGKMLTVKTAAHGASCGYSFTKGASYLVFTDISRDGSHSVSLCSGTHELTKAEAEDERWLKAYEDPKNRSKKLEGLPALCHPSVDLDKKIQIKGALKEKQFRETVGKSGFDNLVVLACYENRAPESISVPVAVSIGAKGVESIDVKLPPEDERFSNCLKQALYKTLFSQAPSKPAKAEVSLSFACKPFSTPN